MKAKPIILMLITAFVLTGLTAGCKQNKDYPAQNDQPSSSGMSVVYKPVNKSGAPTCSSCLAGLVVPQRDIQVVDDSNYTEVLALDASKWDSARLPKKVVELRDKGYICSPKPLESSKGVQWECQEGLRDYRNLTKHEGEKKVVLEKEGYTCQKVNCFDEQEGDTYTWYCSK